MSDDRDSRGNAYPKPHLTDGEGRPREGLVSDAPRALKALARTQVPRTVRGPGMRGAWARGWCDGVRHRPAMDNPYARTGSGFHAGMAGKYADGWRSGRDVWSVNFQLAAEHQDKEWRRLTEVATRVDQIMTGEIVSPATAVKRRRK